MHADGVDEEARRVTRAPRSWLFVPGDRPERIGKALASGADAVIVDLEDSVAPAAKAHARDAAGEVLSGGGAAAWLRVNPFGSAEHEADVALARGLPIAGVVLPKAERGADVARLGAALEGTGLAIHAIVTETAASLFGLGSYGGASERLRAMSWGAEDLSAALGASAKLGADGALSFTYRMARSLTLAGARAAGVQPVDGIFGDIRDEAGLRAEAEAARREGWGGKLAIHPAQVPIINAAWTPSAEEVARARAVVDAFADGAGVVQLDGRMLDRPHLVQAERVLALAG